MNNLRKVYISLGSNKGDKFKNLQDAINAIHLNIDNISIISKVYTSPAFGFQGEDFFNACLIIETSLKPQKLLSKLLKIEKSFGRIRPDNYRSKKKGYQDRIIDLDIIFFEDEIVNSKTLQIPHPEMHKRKFVLQPLSDIAPDEQHPNLEKKVSTLLEECKDKSVLEPINIWLKNPSKSYDFSKHNYIAIEGNIGAGKTSLATKMAHDFNAKLILERFADNPF
ncbi:MAG: 2-amino-4-hydroxy-6-hydroxymethyldihydropteridine diphosphokinase, partial [Bacteroidetes bacterium]|nr:2-amino-4-hydroxy-6-hydroxymethyldihydropteridine diphosphokinase [Bacteroidota bacterium]